MLQLLRDSVSQTGQKLLQRLLERRCRLAV
jgi:hypothetical protein